jgi:hypothetical protein
VPVRWESSPTGKRVGSIPTLAAEPVGEPSPLTGFKEARAAMIDNPCLRPASLSDVEPLLLKYGFWINNPVTSLFMDGYRLRCEAIVLMYDTEWKKRGYLRSP